ncbi:MAG: polysaccharide deacetylase family protein [Clostridiaceae bacterium]|nr:polysaccharide deacetylase family protein [Clostridiaceae bacterium]
MSLSKNYKFREPWPDGVRCVVSITGDVHDYTGIPGREDREWNDMKYNFDLLNEYGLEGKATFFISGEVAVKHPDVIKEGLKRGYELCPHTFKETQYAIEDWDYNRQQEDICRCIKAFENAAFEYDDYKKGFRTHGYQSNRITREVLSDLGFEYIADMQAWETTGAYNPAFPEKLVNFTAYPQFTGDNGSKVLLEIPDTFANDHFVYRVMKMSPAEALIFWKKQFDKIYRVGGLFQACLHPYISLKEDPGRENTYRQLLEYILSHSAVSFMRMGEISKWWFERFKNSS